MMDYEKCEERKRKKGKKTMVERLKDSQAKPKQEQKVCPAGSRKYKKKKKKRANGPCDKKEEDYWLISLSKTT
jgi:hypothetical protein